MAKINDDIKRAKLGELWNLIYQYKDGQTDNINAEEYPTWVRIVDMLKVAEIEENIYEDFLQFPTHYKIVSGEIVLNRNWRKEEFEKAKTDKYAENDEKANTYLEHTFTIEVGTPKTECQFIYNAKTENNLNSAALLILTGQIETKEWTDEQGTTVNLTAEDIATIGRAFKDFADTTWAKWGVYKKQIDACTTKTQLDAIVIDYTIEL